jgi:putative methanogenesis marker protein 3
MITIHLDGERMEVPEGATLKSILPAHPPDCCVAIIRPSTKEESRTGSFAISTTAGEISLEAASTDVTFFDNPESIKDLSLHWSDRYAAAFGPFPSAIRPSRRPHLYERDDVILGCGGYDPKNSYLIFSKSRHSADHGADENGGVIARVVSGRAVLDRWTTGDKIVKVTPVVSWADTSRSFTTNDRGLVLENGLQVVTHLDVMAQGYSEGHVTTEAAGSVEHMLLACESGRYTVTRATSTHILDDRLAGSEVTSQFKRPRREGTVTVRTAGRSSGGLYIYRTDVTGSPAHSTVGQVVHGIELARLAKENDTFIFNVSPSRIDLLGLPLPRAKEIALAKKITLVVDKDGDDRIVVSQEPGTTLDVLSEGKATVTTAPYAKVVDIELFDSAAPMSCDVFRRVTGLREHDAGMMPLFFKFDDVFLFKPVIPTELRLVPENVPPDEVPSAALGITNDSRKGAGLVGVRLSVNREFGPTSEPFEGTNIIGRVVDTEKLKGLKEKEKVYIREVKS